MNVLRGDILTASTQTTVSLNDPSETEDGHLEI